VRFSETCSVVRNICLKRWSLHLIPNPKSQVPTHSRCTLPQNLHLSCCCCCYRSTGGKQGDIFSKIPKPFTLSHRPSACKSSHINQLATYQPALQFSTNHPQYAPKPSTPNFIKRQPVFHPQAEPPKRFTLAVPTAHEQIPAGSKLPSNRSKKIYIHITIP